MVAACAPYSYCNSVICGFSSTKDSVNLRDGRVTLKTVEQDIQAGTNVQLCIVQLVKAKSLRMGPKNNTS